MAGIGNLTTAPDGTCALFGLSVMSRLCLSTLKRFETHIPKLRGSVGFRLPGPIVKLWVCILLKFSHCVVISFHSLLFIFIDALIRNILLFFRQFSTSSCGAFLPLRSIKYFRCNEAEPRLPQEFSVFVLETHGLKTIREFHIGILSLAKQKTIENPFKSKLDTGTVLQCQELLRTGDILHNDQDAILLSSKWRLVVE